MATNHEANVTLGGDASGAQAAARTASKEVDAFDKAVGRAKFGASKLSDSVRQSAKAWDVAAEAAKKAELATFIAKARMENAAASATKLATATTAVGKAAHGAGNLTKVLGSQVHAVAVGANSFGQALNMTLSTLGPWGIAIGVATTLLGHFIGEQYEASKAADAHTKKLLEQKRALAEQKKDEKRKELETGASKHDLTRGRQAELEAVSRIERERKQAIADAHDAADELEKQIAINKTLKVNSDKLHKAKAEQLEIIALRQGDIDQAAKIRQAEELRAIEDTGKAEKKNHAARKEHLSELEQLLGKGADTRFAQMVAGHKGSDEAWREFQKTQLGFGDAKTIDPFSGEDIDRQKAEAAARAKASLNDSLRGTQTEFAANDAGPFADMNASPAIARIEQERVARQEFNDFMLEQQSSELDRMAVLEERKQIDHEATLSRIEAEKEAEQKKKSALVDLAQKTYGAVMGVLDARRQAIRMAKMQGATDKEAAKAGKIAALEQTAVTLRSVRDMAAMKAIFEAGESAAAFARYDIPSGIGHAVAAGIYGTIAVGTGIGANRLEKRADSLKETGGFGGGAGGGAGGSGSGMTKTEKREQERRDKARQGRLDGIGDPNESSIPGSASPSAPSAANGPSGVRDRRTVHFHGPVHLYGTPHEDFMNALEQGRRDLGYDRRLKTGTNG